MRTKKRPVKVVFNIIAEGETLLHRRREARALRGRISTRRLTRQVVSAKQLAVRGLATFNLRTKKRPVKVVFNIIAEGETRTRTRGEPRWILSPLRLPFRHFGKSWLYLVINLFCVEMVDYIEVPT